MNKNEISFAKIAEQFIDEVNDSFPKDDGTVRHAEALESFIEYCAKHPEERFWQALRNWSKFSFILGYNGDVYALYNNTLGLRDTFYLEGLDGTREAYR